MPKEEDSLSRRIPWSIVSKAADKSSKTRAIAYACLLQVVSHVVSLYEEEPFRWNEIFYKQIEKDKWTERFGGVR